MSESLIAPSRLLLLRCAPCGSLAMHDRSALPCHADDSATPLGPLMRQLRALNPDDTPADWMCELAAGGQDRLPMPVPLPLPLPGRGQTLMRWQALAMVAAHDLSLAKLYEGHTDALAILAELGSDAQFEPNPSAANFSPDLHEKNFWRDAPLPRKVWGVWAAESSVAKVVCEPTHSTRQASAMKLYGTKAWCSGAASVTHALLTAWLPDGTGPQLVKLAMKQPGVHVRPGSWLAVGMGGSASVDVTFTGALAQPVGRPGEYLKLPGFWQGGAGVAACWYGGALGLGRTLQRSIQHTALAQRSPFRLAALGKVDVTLHATAGLLRDAAHWIDAHPHDDAHVMAARVRLATEACARHVLDEAGRALGAAPFCHDAAFARAAADLPVYIRQCHGERDFAQLGAWAAGEVPTS